MALAKRSKEENYRRKQVLAREAHVQDVRRTRRHVVREGLCSCMNDTKWRELVSVMRSLAGFTPSYRQKHLRCSEPAQWDKGWFYHLRPYSVVEWVEIDPVDSRRYPQVDRTEEIEQLLRQIHVPFSREGPYLRVWGYLRPGVSPTWA